MLGAASEFQLRMGLTRAFDDQSHVRSNRQDRDEFVDKALQAAGVPIYHFTAKRAYSVGEIQKTLSGGASGADDSEITL